MLGIICGIAVELMVFPDRLDIGALPAAIILSPLLNALAGGCCMQREEIYVLKLFGWIYPAMFVIESFRFASRPTRFAGLLLFLMTAIWYFGVLGRFYRAMSI